MIVFDQSLLAGFKTVEVRIEDLDSGGRYTRTVGPTKGSNSYRLRNRHAVPTRGDVLTTHSQAREGDLCPSFSVDHRGTEVEILDTGRPSYCLLAALSGALETAGPDGKAEAHGTKGMILHSLPGSRIVTSDTSLRLVVWMDAARLERTLQVRLGEPPRESSRVRARPGLGHRPGPGGVAHDPASA